ncbi:FAD-dependent monooxygenase [Actinorugispora endophytica]|uniref:2-polyprenyl-6-methoxyphenol hydroxylase-like FAD-dependent oxidoreductase n=1 Tax=Actinorugispora endophytica TaxID=1605990 RepID=A0A4R6UJV5_9ACTN|nr:FAD-dependent monooxygenase [Actinorugispora endophytica]TDQ47240.1 2-polyprenyl-6-methoxyphenol hydroxylase-like FAD-dependent oxidoreductase [Actinorugispora endophytica]
MTDADVVIAGAGPAGLMLAGELRLAGVRPLVLERRPRPGDIPKANGLGGQILRLLRYRGLLDRFEAAAAGPGHPASRFPFGGVHFDLSHLEDPPLRGLTLPQPRLERLLDERARELGADIRRGHEVVGAGQDDAAVTVDVRGPDGPYRVTARYLVGCDGARGRVRDAAGIPFPGTTYPEVNRLGQVTVPDSVTRLGDGDLDVPGLGRVRAGRFTRTGRGVFGLGWLTSEVLLVSTTEDGPAEPDDAPMTLAELGDSVRRVLGADLPLGEPIRLSRFSFQARQAERYRDGRILLAGDAAHLFPATGVALNAGLLDTVNLAWKLAAAVHGWAPAGLLDTYHRERHFAGARTLLHTQAQVALRRGDDPAAQALREVFLELFADEQPLRRIGALVAGADIRYPLPGADHHALTGAFAPDLALRAGRGASSVAELMRTARPVLLVLADRPDLREAARGWRPRVDVHTAGTGHRPADALLIRPDAHVAWAAAVGEPAATAVPALRGALRDWFGVPS